MSNLSASTSRHAKWTKAEQTAAQGNLFEKMLVHRQQVQDLRNGKPHKLIMVARSLLLCGLPYAPTDATELTRSAKTASGRTQVTYYAMGHHLDGSRIPMARGADRTFLHWAIDRAIKLKNPFVPFDTAREFFDDMEMTLGGANYEALRDTHTRLAGLVIMVEQFDKRGVFREKMDIFDASRLPASVRSNVVEIDGPMGLRFSDKAFAEFSERPVPFLLPLLRSLRKKPQLQDFVLFLHRRCCVAESTCPISWDLLRVQLWQQDTNTSRIRLRMDEAISILKVAWPELNAVTTRDGLLIGPPSFGLGMIPTFYIKQSA